MTSKAQRSYTNDYKVVAVELVTEKVLYCAEAGRRLVLVCCGLTGLKSMGEDAHATARWLGERGCRMDRPSFSL
jgi:hypothetical protein